VLLLLSIASIAFGQVGAEPHPPRAPRPDVSVALDSLRPGVWVHTSHYTYPDGSRFSSNGLVVRDGAGLTLIDTAWGEKATETLLDRIARDIGVPVRRAIVTHAHGDRTAGSDVLRDRGVPVQAHPRSITLALETGLPPPSDSLAGLSRRRHDARQHGARGPRRLAGRDGAGARALRGGRGRGAGTRRGGRAGASPAHAVPPGALSGTPPGGAGLGIMSRSLRPDAIDMPTKPPGSDE
jgi:hypothetical protein